MPDPVTTALTATNATTATTATTATIGTGGAGRPPGRRAGVAAGSVGMVFVGGSVAVSSVLASAPLLTAQALRYAVACLLLVAGARSRSRGGTRRLLAPRGGEWGWLLGVAVTGLVVFNVALVHGSRHAEPAVLGVAVACVPLLLAVAGPVLDRHRPSPALAVAALLVTGGAVLVQGAGRSDGTGLAWAAVVFACEAAFTLLAVPVLRRIGPWGVSVHTTWLVATILAVLGALTEGPAAVARLRVEDLLAVTYLALAVTALAFVLWYTCVERIGAGRAGLLTGIAPVAATVTGVALGGDAPAPPVWVGVAAVAAGLALGLGRGDSAGDRQARPAPRLEAAGEVGGAGQAE